MGTIVISTNVTLDGVSEDPTGDEGQPFGGWFERISASDREAWAKIEYEESLGASALLLGGRSYDWFAARWVDRAGEWGERRAVLRARRVHTAAVAHAGVGGAAARRDCCRS
jgi:hypothetical protein